MRTPCRFQADHVLMTEGELELCKSKAEQKPGKRISNKNTCGWFSEHRVIHEKVGLPYPPNLDSAP
eukprot:5286180-Karenia_brevis.AAC.1